MTFNEKLEEIANTYYYDREAVNSYNDEILTDKEALAKSVKATKALFKETIGEDEKLSRCCDSNYHQGEKDGRNQLRAELRKAIEGIDE